MSTKGNKNEPQFMIEEWRETLYQQVVEEFPVSIAIFTVGKDEAVRRWVPPAMVDISDYEKDELESNPSLWLQIIHQADIEQVRDALRKLDKKRSFTIEYRIFRKDGQMRWVRESCVAEKETDGQHLRVIESIRNITDEFKEPDFPVRYKRILNETPGAVVITDTSGRLIHYSDSCASVIEPKLVRRLEKKGISELLSPEDISNILIDGHLESDIEYNKDDGTKAYIRIVGSVVKGSADIPIAIYFIMNDVTEEREIEQEQIKLSAVVDAATEGIIFGDQTGYMTYVNNAVEKMFGYTLKDFQTYGNNIVFEDPKVLHESIIPSLVSGETWNGEVRMLRKDGKHLVVEVHAAPVFDKQRQLLGCMITHNDITDRKSTDERMHSSEELLKAILNSLSSRIAVIDKQGNIIAINHAWVESARKNGDPKLEHTGVGQNYLDVCRRAKGRYSEGAKDVLKNLEAVLEGRIERFEYEYICPNEDNEYWFTLQVEPLLRENGGAVCAHVNITDRKRAEEALKISEVNYRLLIENQTDLVVKIDADEKLLFVSPSYLKLFNKTEEELIGKPFTPLIHPDDVEKTMEEMKHLYEPPYECYVEQRARTRYGWKWIGWADKAALDENGDVSAIVGVGRDITDRKQAEEALKESEDKYRNLVERSNIGIVVLQDSVIKFVNQKFVELSGYDIEQLIGTPFTDYLTPDEIVLLYDRYRRRMAGESLPSVYETIMTRKNGEKIDVEISAGIVPFRGKTADMVLFRDIRERKRAEEALKESEEKYRTLVEGVDAVIVRLNDKFQLITIAGRPSTIIGYTIDELLEDNELWRRIVHPDDRGILNDKLDEMVANREATSVEYRIISAKAETRWIRGHFMPQFDSMRRLTHIDGVALDVTEKVEAQLRDERHAARMGALAEISQLFTSSLDFNYILGVAAEKTANVLNCLTGIMSIDQETEKVHYLVIYHRSKSKLARVISSFYYIEVMEQDAFCEAGINAQIIPDLTNVSSRSNFIFDQAGLGPGMMAPVSREDETIYVITCARFKGEPQFDEEDLWFLTEIASHCSAALLNADLYRRQSEIAETLQRSLIPSAPTIQCLDLATLYSPAKGIAGVGGDFFDIINFSDCVLGLVIGDVSGKGIDAAVHTAEAKYMLRGFAHQNPDPAYVMNSLNDALYKYTNEFTFITLIYILIDISNCIITSSNAGHEVPVILCTKYRDIIELTPNGPVLGVKKGHKYESVSHKFKNDDLLFCYTDGLVDVPINGERFGYKRLVETIRRSTAVSSQELMDFVMGEVRRLSNGRQPDDQVVVVARPR